MNSLRQSAELGALGVVVKNNMEIYRIGRLTTTISPTDGGFLIVKTKPARIYPRLEITHVNQDGYISLKHTPANGPDIDNIKVAVLDGASISGDFQLSIPSCNNKTLRMPKEWIGEKILVDYDSED